MLRPYIMLTDARAPHPDWPRARVPGVAVARLAIPRSARLSGAAREPSRSQGSGRRERRGGRAGLGRWDEAGGLVFRTETATNLLSLPNLRWPPLVLRQR